MANGEESKLNDVQRRGFAEAELANAAADVGVPSDLTDKEIKGSDGKILKTLLFRKVRFDLGDPTEAFGKAIEFYRRLQPVELNDAGVTVRANDPLRIILAHLTSSQDLANRNFYQSRENAILEGPDKAIQRAAEKLSQQKGIPLEKALARVRAAWAD